MIDVKVLELVMRKLIDIFLKCGAQVLKICLVHNCVCQLMDND